MIDVHEASTNLARLVERVEQGEEILIGRSGKPVARLVPLRESRAPRTPGGWEGRVTIAHDFDGLPPAADTACRGARA